MDIVFLRFLMVFILSVMLLVVWGFWVGEGVMVEWEEDSEMDLLEGWGEWVGVCLMVGMVFVVVVRYVLDDWDIIFKVCFRV